MKHATRITGSGAQKILFKMLLLFLLVWASSSFLLVVATVFPVAEQA